MSDDEIDDEITEASKLTGDLAWEHDVTESADSLWRVHSIGSWINNRFRHSIWFITREAAEAEAARLRARGDEIISVTEYKRVNT